MIDNLSYNYNGNSILLSSVSDASNNLRGFKGASSSNGYDPTGNLISDSQKGITDIAYTYNDLPIKITSANGTIENFYTSAGEKLKSIITPTNQEINAGPVTRIYLGSAEYVDGELEAVYTDEGRVVISKDGNYPEYYLKDHLGNTRVRIADKNLDNLVYIDPNDPENDELMSTHHYYPFGMEWDTPALDVSGNDLGETGVDSRYTYNGKEEIDDLGIDLLDYGWRYYDPAIGRFTTIDPLTESNHVQSGYVYANNNPISMIDFMGLDATNVIQKAWDSTPDDGRTHHYDGYGNSTGSSDASADDDCCPGVERRARMQASQLAANNSNISYDQWYQDYDEAENEFADDYVNAMLMFVPVHKLLTGARYLWLASRAGQVAKGATPLLKSLKAIDKLDELKLYRGLTGSEATGATIFFTDNAAVAASYVKNGGHVVQVVISKVQAQKMLWSNTLQKLSGVHGPTGAISTEYKFLGAEVKQALMSMSN